MNPTAQGYRVVVELKRDADADVILNQLYRFTPLQTSFGCNMVALNGGKPEVMNLPDMLKAFITFREEVVVTAHQISADEVPRAGACVGRSGDCRRQHRRGDRTDPPCAGPGRQRANN